MVVKSEQLIGMLCQKSGFVLAVTLTCNLLTLKRNQLIFVPNCTLRCKSDEIPTNGA